MNLQSPRRHQTPLPPCRRSAERDLFGTGKTPIPASPARTIAPSGCWPDAPQPPGSDGLFVCLFVFYILATS